mgnify:CR=1 FL=1
MKLYPAIDLRNGQVVRLTQGDYDKMTVYGTDPCAQARQFVAAGAKYLHVVDLDGAKDGTLSNYDTIAALAKQGGLYLEVGGGIRTEERIEKYLSLGVGRCILGSVAVTDFEFTVRMLQKYGDQIAVGVDAKDGFVAIHGWKEVSAEKGVDFCKRLAAAGCKAIIYTDIACDGAYADLAAFEPIVATDGDCYARCQVRCAEVTQAMDIIKELVGKIPHDGIGGRTKLTPADGARGEVVIEQPRGEAYYYVRGNGTKNLDRFRVRTPTSQNLAGLTHALQGVLIANVPMIILTIDPCISCTER